MEAHNIPASTTSGLVNSAFSGCVQSGVGTRAKAFARCPNDLLSESGAGPDAEKNGFQRAFQAFQAANDKMSGDRDAGSAPIGSPAILGQGQGEGAGNIKEEEIWKAGWLAAQKGTQESSSSPITNRAKCKTTNQKNQTLIGALDCGNKIKVLPNLDSDVAKYNNKNRWMGAPAQYCPDDLTRGRYWIESAKAGVKMCVPFTVARAADGTTVKGRSGVVNKAQIVHPHLATKTVAALAIKRIGLCTATRSGPSCPVFKTGICIDCRGLTNPLSKCPKEISWIHEIKNKTMGRKGVISKKICEWYQEKEEEEDSQLGSTKSKRRKTKKTKKTTKTTKTQQAIQKLAKITTNWFWQKFQGAAKTEELQNFAHYCIPAAFGYAPEKYWSPDFEPESLHLRKDFMCSNDGMDDIDIFDQFMKAY